MAQAWNGRWFHRAYAPDVAPVGDTQLWLEVQPWAILCGAADAEQTRSLLATIDQGNRAGSPLGTRLRWPPTQKQLDDGTWGEATLGGIWYAINMTLIWAATKVAGAGLGRVAAHFAAQSCAGLPGGLGRDAVRP